MEQGGDDDAILGFNKNKFFHFQGDTLGGKPDGAGLLRLSNGVTVQGEFVRGELKGPGTKRWADGSIFYGAFENGEPHGFGRHFTVATLQDFEGFYEQGFKKGLGTLVDHMQGTIFRGDFNRDYPNGKGELVAIGGDLTSPLHVKGYWEGGRLHGIAMATLANGDYVVGTAEHGLWSGTCSFTTCHVPCPPEIEAISPFTHNANTISDASAAAGPVGLMASGNANMSVNTGTLNNSFATAIGTPSPPPPPQRSRITYRGQFVDGARAEVPNMLKLKSAVLLRNRAPLDRTDPDSHSWANANDKKGGKGGRLGSAARYGKGAPPKSAGGLPPLGGTLRQQQQQGRVGSATVSPPQSPKGVSGGNTATAPATRAPAAESATQLITAPCLIPLRLQVGLACKTVRTINVRRRRSSVSSPRGGGAAGLMSGSVLGSPLKSGRPSSSASAAGSLASPLSTKDGGGKGAMGSSTLGSPFVSAVRGGSGKKGGASVGILSDDEDMLLKSTTLNTLTEEVISFQRSETGRRLFARLYTIRDYVLAGIRAEDWAAEVVRLKEEAVAEEQARIAHEEAEAARGRRGSNINTNGDAFNLVVHPPQEGDDSLNNFNFSPRSVSTESSNASRDGTPPKDGKAAAKKAGAATANKGGKGGPAATPAGAAKSLNSTLKATNSTTPARGTLSNLSATFLGGKNGGKQMMLLLNMPSTLAPQGHTKAELIASLIAYLTPSNLTEAMEGKPLPPGVFAHVFGVGGTPPPPPQSPKGSPRGTSLEGGTSHNVSMSITNQTHTNASSSGGGQPPQFLPQPNVTSGRAGGGIHAALRRSYGGAINTSSVSGAGPDGIDLNMSNFNASGGGLDAATNDGNSRPVSAATNATFLCRPLPSYHFPTEEELTSTCKEGMATFEFYLPDEGEYLFESFVSDYVQLTPGNNLYCRELAASLLVPFLGAPTSSLSADAQRPTSGGTVASDEGDYDDEDEDEADGSAGDGY